MTTDKLETGGPAFPLPCDDDRDCFSRANSGYGGMTTRTYAAIHLGVPQSEHEFINDMIRESQRFELAKAAMEGIEASQGNGGNFVSTEVKVAARAFQLADAMLAEQEKK